MNSQTLGGTASLCPKPTSESVPSVTDAMPSGGQHHETSDHYARVVFTLCHRHRVIVCKDAIQWIVQQRKKGGAERPWRGVGYFRTRNALIRLCASLCSRIDPGTMAALAALPEVFGGAQ